MISASTSGPRRTGPPPERDFPRPPRRRFLLPEYSPFELAAGAGAADGRVSPICGLRFGSAIWPAGRAPGPFGAVSALAEPSADLVRFFPPREPRRRFFGPDWPSPCVLL